MTTSRYDTTANKTPASATDFSSTGSTSGSTGGTSTGTAVKNESSTNMDPKSLAALQTLIAQLMGGGTQAMAKDAAARKGEVNKVTQQRAGYSKDAAFADAQGLMAQTMRRAMEQLLPSINRASEGAGASQSSLRALLLQDAAARAAEGASAQGLNAAVQYGQIGTGLSQVLEALTRPDNTVSNALLQALNIAKGAVTSGQSITQTTGTETKNSTATENKGVDYAPFGQTPQTSGGGLQYFGPTISDKDAVLKSRGRVEDSLQQLLANDMFAGFRF